MMQIRSRIRPLMLGLALTSALAVVPAWAGDDDSHRHEYKWVHKLPHGLYGGGFLGVQAVDITPELRRHYGAPESAGLLIAKVIEDSPAEAAGVEVGDILTTVGGDEVETHGGLVSKLLRREPGDSVDLEVYRDGRRLSLSAELTKSENPFVQSLGEGIHFIPRFQFQELNLSDLPDIDVEAFSNLGKDLSVYFSGPEWKESLKKLDGNKGYLLDRLEEMETRLKEMETRLKKAEGRN